MWDSTFIEYWGTAEREGKERVCHCATYQAPEAPEEGRAGQAFIFYFMSMY